MQAFESVIFVKTVKVICRVYFGVSKKSKNALLLRIQDFPQKMTIKARKMRIGKFSEIEPRQNGNFGHYRPF